MKPKNQLNNNWREEYTKAPYPYKDTAEARQYTKDVKKGLKIKNQLIKQPVPTEHVEQVHLVQWLRNKGLVFCSVPNGVWTRGDFRQIAKLKREGMQSGVPDILIFTNLLLSDEKTFIYGVAVEMKRQKGGVQSIEQKEWQKKLEECGWIYILAKGCEDAVNQLTELGY